MIKSFITDTGRAVPAVTADQMREIDRIAVEVTGPNIHQMMENAGRNLAALALREMVSRRAPAKVAVLAGAGGNGGGGICAARHLANRGVDVSLCLAAPDRLGKVPAWQRHIFRGTPGREVAARELAARATDLVLDALIGYGLRGAPRGVFAELIDWVNSAGAPVLSLDVPSGIDSTTGEAAGLFVRPSVTMTLALPKTGLEPERTGRLLLADIGIPRRAYRELGLTDSMPFDDRYVVPIQARRE